MVKNNNNNRARRGPSSNIRNINAVQWQLSHDEKIGLAEGHCHISKHKIDIFPKGAFRLQRYMVKTNKIRDKGM